MTAFTRIDFRTGHVLAVADPAARRPLLLEGETLHRQLRPLLEADYPAQVERLIPGGARLAQIVDEGEVRAIALWRVFETTYCGWRLEIEDLVSDEAHRSKGYGAAMIGWLNDQAVALGCPTTTLISGTHRTRAHRFYFREGYAITAFHFVRETGVS
ncbi:GNAT family N-acetyltransferase [Brevundimonas sp.]|uniref:GNAT family N-acetyltransferase n=1 Tax=Brevundimonas sp. TaxID=1871086 RepID=UPI002ED7808B